MGVRLMAGFIGALLVWMESGRAGGQLAGMIGQGAGGQGARIGKGKGKGNAMA
jgi:hypothetical protein